MKREKIRRRNQRYMRWATLPTFEQMLHRTLVKHRARLADSIYSYNSLYRKLLQR